MSPSASSGVGIAHLPNQRHKIVSKRGANFTLMVCGKTLFLTYLYTLLNTSTQQVNLVSVKLPLSTPCLLLVLRIKKSWISVTLNKSRKLLKSKSPKQVQYPKKRRALVIIVDMNISK